MAIVSYEVPEIKLNGKDIDIKNMHCRKLEIIKEVGHADIAKLELIGEVEIIKPVTDARLIDITVIDYANKKKTKFRAINIIEEDIEE